MLSTMLYNADVVKGVILNFITRQPTRVRGHLTPHDIQTVEEMYVRAMEKPIMWIKK